MKIPPALDLPLALKQTLYGVYQTFDATKDGVIGSVEVYVVKRSPTSGDAKPGNLVAAIYPITDGVAGEALQTVTVPEAQVNDKAPTSIDFNVQVEPASAMPWL